MAEKIPDFKVKKELRAYKERLAEAEKFINSLSRKPALWRLGGSTKEGNFRPDSDLDIYALYDREEDFPLEEIFARTDSDNDLIDGFIDFHYFAADWEVYERNPDLLEKFKKTFEKSEN